MIEKKSTKNRYRFQVRIFLLLTLLYSLIMGVKKSRYHDAVDCVSN